MHPHICPSGNFRNRSGCGRQPTAPGSLGQPQLRLPRGKPPALGTGLGAERNAGVGGGRVGDVGREKASCAVPRRAMAEPRLRQTMATPCRGHAKLWPCWAMAVLSPFCGHAVTTPRATSRQCHAGAMPCRACAVAVPCHVRGRVVPMLQPCCGHAISMRCHGRATGVPWPCCAVAMLWP